MEKTPEQKTAQAADRDRNPAIIAKRKRARENYIVSEGQVLNPDESDWRRPAVTQEEADKITATLNHKKKGH